MILAKSKFMFMVLIFSIINWLPVVMYSYFHISAYKIWMILLPACFITPVVAFICFFVAAIEMLRRKISIVLGGLIIIVNVIYLLKGVHDLRLFLYSA